MQNFGFYQVACASFPIHVMDVDYNVACMIDIINKSRSDLQMMTFGELSITGYTCQDLFFSPVLLESAKKGLMEIAKNARKNILIAVGLPMLHEGRIFDTCAFIFNHEILGFQVKAYLPNRHEFNETRWFNSGFEIENEWIEIDGVEVPFTTRLIISDITTGAKVASEISSDLEALTPISNTHYEHGANVIVNLAASDELVTKSAYRHDLVKMQSRKLGCGYLYACGGYHESTSDLLFSSQQIIAQNGRIIKEINQEGVLETTIDLEVIANERIYSTVPTKNEAITVEIKSEKVNVAYLQKVDAYPFIPEDAISRCKEIMDIQSKALSVRLNHLSSHNVVVGISGGLDSTLALLVCHRTFEMNGWDPKDIIAVTMPGFGTTDQTYQNALKMIELLNATFLEISIKEAVTQHFLDIQHDINQHDVTYENAQARERTQILMDLANQYNAIVVGTGDLSEMALGWCTYNGDHMSMYSVNASIPKTLVSSVVEMYAKVYTEGELSKVLMDVVNTPISPELLPPDKEGKIAQKTESSVGKYKYNDFFLYYFVRYHFGPKKLFYLATLAFPEANKEELLKTLNTFHWRFFTQQFKRNCVPDGIKVGTISLSPRGDWRMPSDAYVTLWKKELAEIKVEE